MKEITRRSIVRSIHLVLAIPVIGYVYSPFELLPTYAARVRYVVIPGMLLSGLWMWKGEVLRRWMLKKKTERDNATGPAESARARGL
jgi:hypothetical protein